MISQRSKLLAKSCKKKTSNTRKLKAVTKWFTLEHNGVLFPSPYISHNLFLKIRGKKLNLERMQEEMAWAWAKKKDTPYVQDDVFVSNFLLDFRKILPRDYSDVKMNEIDFSNIIHYQEEEKQRNSQPEVKKQLSAERKQLRERLKEGYGYANIDGHRTEVANYMVEPPGIFMGRGKHPLRGRWKSRIYPKDVTLNLGKDAPIPPSPINGMTWGKVIHDNQSMWLASWVDGLTKKAKYVWLHDSSNIRQQRDKVKYDDALKLASKLGRVRTHIRKGMSSNKEKIRKTSSVCYLIDKLCMRVGDEKDDDEADTVGASTLRVEHVKITPNIIQFEFLGKDSVPWSKRIKVNDKDSHLFSKNLSIFTANKHKTDPIFEGVRSADINRFLGRAMKGLTAKVFRTFHASNTIRKYLQKHDDCKDDVTVTKVFHAKMANLEAAVTCNHKRTPPKNWELALNKKKDRLKKISAKSPKTEKAKIRHSERIMNIKLNIQLAKKTRDYNLNTSLRNYIDPRIYKSWSDHVELDIKKIYPKTLQRKFSWVNSSKTKWSQNQ